MQAMVLDKFGGVENLHLRDIDSPKPQAGEVLVRIFATALNPIDIKTRIGEGAANFTRVIPPVILGWDLSGIVVSCGEGVDEWQPGDEVFGSVGFPGLGRTQAQYATVAASDLTRKPKTVSHIDCAAASMVGLTAWQALTRYVRPCAGDKVLIHGASGGVGNMAVQIARALGAHVIATASKAKCEQVLASGANSVIDYKNTPFSAYPRGVDFVFDTAGGDTTLASLNMLREGGTLVSILPPTDDQVFIQALNSGRQYHFTLMTSSGHDMAEVGALLDTGSIRSDIGITLPLTDLSYAHILLEEHKISGKIVLIP
jgi:NADPH:quinone reductase-like Zn-dependent oxidoreductase